MILIVWLFALSLLASSILKAQTLFEGRGEARSPIFMEKTATVGSNYLELFPNLDTGLDTRNNANVHAVQSAAEAHKSEIVKALERTRIGEGVTVVVRTYKDTSVWSEDKPISISQPE